jgi:sarcosine oxidase
MGSAVAAQAAKRGLTVAGIEQFAPVHAFGASHGRTRLIRMAYFEGAEYVPLLRRSYELWDELELQSGRVLRSRSGAIFVGNPQTELIAGTLGSAARYGLAAESLTHAELGARYPHLHLQPDEVGVYEPVAGAVFPEATVEAQLESAQRYGAILQFETRIEKWVAEADTVRLTLAGGAEVTARKLVLTIGPWFAQIFAELGIALQIERNVQTWFEPQTPGTFEPERFPAFALERAGRFFYGFPDYGDGVKCAFHHTGVFTDPHTLDRTVSAAEIEENRAALHAFIPQAAGAYRGSVACMYALTPDHHFVIGPHPRHDNVFLAGGFSGHGFKFVPVIGEILTNYVMTGKPGHDITMFDPQRAYSGR